jgi:hypothetical protein
MVLLAIPWVLSTLEAAQLEMGMGSYCIIQVNYSIIYKSK